MKTCTNCNGEGIVGQGDKPWLQIGHKETCKVCGGTGKVSDGAADESQQTQPEEAASTNTAPESGDNSPKEDGSPDGSGDSQASSDQDPA